MLRGQSSLFAEVKVEPDRDDLDEVAQSFSREQSPQMLLNYNYSHAEVSLLPATPRDISSVWHSRPVYWRCNRSEVLTGLTKSQKLLDVDCGRRGHAATLSKEFISPPTWLLITI